MPGRRQQPTLPASVRTDSFQTLQTSQLEPRRAGNERGCKSPSPAARRGPGEGAGLGAGPWHRPDRNETPCDTPPPPPPVPDACALQPAPDALAEEEEPVLLKRGLRDIKKRPEQLDHVRAHQPAQELGQNGLSQTVLGGLDMASVWEEKGGCSTRAPPASSPEGPGQVWAACGVSGRRSRGGGGYLGNGASPRGV